MVNIVVFTAVIAFLTLGVSLLLSKVHDILIFSPPLLLSVFTLYFAFMLFSGAVGLGVIVVAPLMMMGAFASIISWVVAIIIYIKRSKVE